MHKADVSANSYRSRPPRVLVIDDHPATHELGTYLRLNLGYTADVVANCVQALERHRALPFDLILMNCGLRHDDDVLTARHLRQQDCAARRTPVIALAAAEQWDSCLDAEVDDVLAKPLSLQALEAILAQWLPATTSDTHHQAASSSPEAVRAVFGSHFAELVTLYRAGTPARISALSEASQDSHAIARLAHLLAGSSASMGASRLAALSRQLEYQAKQNNIGVFPSYFTAIEAEYRQLDRQLCQMLLES